MAQARLREALNAGGPGTKEKGPPVADGLLSITPDTPEAIEFRTRRSIFDSVGASSSYLEDETGATTTILMRLYLTSVKTYGCLHICDINTLCYLIRHRMGAVLLYLVSRYC